MGPSQVCCGDRRGPVFRRGRVGRRGSDGLYGGIFGALEAGLARNRVILSRIRGIRGDPGRSQRTPGRSYGPLRAVFPSSRPHRTGGGALPEACFSPIFRWDQAWPAVLWTSLVESYGLLIDPPLRVMRWALLRRRSRMASPKVGSPTTSCQCSTGTWLASSVPRRA